jgi:23S rRNA (cytidine1920-2'-O)/16S rRNA (cytidine1409-2'-O)-methyltransferase
VRRPLDQELVRRGLASDRNAAREVIASGRVRVAGRPVLKDSTLVRPEDALALGPQQRRFVSRGGEKLAAALGRFEIDPTERRCLDAGASTGGFTDCLLRAGALHVVAVDVGYGQLDWTLRNDPRVTVLERTNVRGLRAENLPYRPELVTADLSFISLASVLPALVGLSGPDAEFVLLVKPQFEAPPEAVEAGGVVRDPATRAAAIHAVARAGEELGLRPLGIMASPLLGPAGNAEFLLHARPEGEGGGGSVALDVAAAVAAAGVEVQQ